MTDLLLRKAQTVRAGAQGDEDYDVISADGTVIGRIFEATTSPIGTPGMWILTYGDQEDRRQRTDMKQHAKPLCRHLLGTGTERRDRAVALNRFRFCGVALHGRACPTRSAHKTARITAAMTAAIMTATNTSGV